MYHNRSIRSALARAAFIMVAAVLIGPSAAHAQKAPAANTDPFIGTWKLNISRSRLHSGEHYSSYSRTYATDGEKVRVSWIVDDGSGKAARDGYSARCDGKEEPANAGSRIRCWTVDTNTVDGEMIGSDPVHRLYRRQVSSDGKRLTLIWYSDAKRQTESELMVFDRVS
jgi:hypothetical protein